MPSYLSVDSSVLLSQSALHTAREIAQQPHVWRQAAQTIATRRAEIDQWLQPLLARPDLRIVLTGAGSSAYIGDTLAPFLAQQMPLTTQTVEAISTTDLVSSPQRFFSRQRPTLLVSYARSGNSPESIATVELAEQLLGEIYHLIITCNSDGQLAAFAQQQQHNRLLLMMPNECNDQSFAMTSSFSTMLLGTLCLFAPDAEALAQAAALAAHIINEQTHTLRQIAEQPSERIVFLGAGCLQAVAREAALKYLELTAGKVVSFFESPLGFRHGPKSLVNQKTQVIVLCSVDRHAALYDQDLLAEMRRDNQALSITALSLEGLPCPPPSHEIWAALPMLVYGQMLAFYRALALGISPDNPCPSGLVNRVVQGVVIHPLVIDTPT